MNLENGDTARARSNCWSHIEEVFLVGAVMSRWWTRGSLAAQRSGNTSQDSCWDDIKETYDKNWLSYKKSKSPAERSANALARHFKVMKTRISNSRDSAQPDSFQNYYLEWELVYNGEHSTLLQAVRKILAKFEPDSARVVRRPSLGVKPGMATARIKKQKDRSFSESFICEENKQEPWNPETRRNLYDLITSEQSLDQSLGLARSRSQNRIRSHGDSPGAHPQGLKAPVDEGDSKHMRKRVYSSTTGHYDNHSEYYNTVAGADGALMAAQLKHELSSFGRHQHQNQNRYHISERFKYRLQNGSSQRKKSATRIDENKVLEPEAEAETSAGVGVGAGAGARARAGAGAGGDEEIQDETKYVSELFGIFGIDSNIKSERNASPNPTTSGLPEQTHMEDAEDDKPYYNTVSGADAAKMAAQLRYEQEHNKRHVAVEVNRTYESMETKRRLLHRARTVQHLGMGSGMNSFPQATTENRFELRDDAGPGVNGAEELKRLFQEPFSFGQHGNDRPDEQVELQHEQHNPGGHNEHEHEHAHGSAHGHAHANGHQEQQKTFHRDLLDSQSQKQRLGTTSRSSAPMKNFLVNHNPAKHLTFLRKFNAGLPFKDKQKQHQQQQHQQQQQQQSSHQQQ